MLLQMLIVGELRYAVRRGGRLRYRQGELRDVSFLIMINEIEDFCGRGTVYGQRHKEGRSERPSRALE